ncbi:hypothetical protein [Yoonia sp.]|uniref:hypothetical protein n=1 Tax=Yoonia sp. TaxID=2212373 RepID=UPI003974E8F0
MDYEVIELFAAGAAITGTAADDFLVGIGENSFTGGAGADLFVVSYGTSVTDEITASVIADFKVGSDKIGLIRFDALAGFEVDLPEDRLLIQQGVTGDDPTISVANADGVGLSLVATLTGVAAELDGGADQFVFAAGTGLDIVYDFTDGVDLIRLDGLAFAAPVR